MGKQKMSLGATVLGAPDAAELAAFYRDLLGWTVSLEEPGWIELLPPGGGSGLSFQTESNHIRPSWPATGTEQQMMMHLDIAVEDVSDAVKSAEALGASLASWQPQDEVRVMIDPAGHPFCFYKEE